MSEPRLTAPDALQLYIEESLARVRQLHLDADLKTQEIAAGPRLLRLKIWQLVIAAAAAAALGGGALGYKLGANPLQPPIVIVVPK
jgi:hypothetical protein